MVTIARLAVHWRLWSLMKYSGFRSLAGQSKGQLDALPDRSR